MLHRRRLLGLAGATLAMPAITRSAFAQAYPARPVKWVVGFAPGGITDMTARLIAQRLAERLGQAFVIENRAGAGGNVGTESVARAEPDGYTLLQTTTTNAINAALYKNLPFDTMRDLAPVAGIMRAPGLLVVANSVPAKTVGELVAYAKKNPGKLSIGTGGNGSSQHAYGELFKMLAGIEMLVVPFRGGAPAIAALMGGQIDVVIGPAAEAMELAAAGKIRALGVTSKERIASMPDVPPISDELPGYETGGWHGVCTTAKTPPAVIEILSRGVMAAVAEPKIVERITQMAGTPMPLDAAGFRQFMTDEIEKWEKVVKFAGMRAE
ncbi:tripartite tricarboxylate transporter family receptor [Variibacter gotjawalensis]|uniref:Tripartite tricarboxylate transporter family receptor n=1 Tax=Variibacter gotjawalensis TaxID=1333996 RepID=A0A0S3Q074_9BRAD|nr:tripartite tricarboxylate transporter substrate binding protein [Variibacter gotjawalensis]NIK47405.1 tripartite-type tricarboxylate transporter receptor subunit TctC [Variibacter gotjawalensis]RZS49301.1 tripartite-type tricarboxylate transporter receptor subunit TctC [Variibacter gotjawalensis]BAT61565.1 tripartite tricarboxylate transporter family receptor [Variibacter gotjawalensis]